MVPSGAWPPFLVTTAVTVIVAPVSGDALDVDSDEIAQVSDAGVGTAGGFELPPEHDVRAITPRSAMQVRAFFMAPVPRSCPIAVSIR